MIYDVVTIGGLIQDIIFFIEKNKGLVLKNTKDLLRQKFLAFELYAKIYIKDAYLGPGGGAANTAVSFSSLGLKTAIISCVGKDSMGEELIKNLREKGIETKFVEKTAKKTTGFSLINSLEGDGFTIFSFRGADEGLEAANLKKIKTKWFYVSSLSSHVWQKILERVLKTGSRIAFNPGQIQLEKINYLKKFLPKIDILILNKDEAYEIIRKKLKIEDLCQAVHSLGSKIVVITDGAKGAAAYDGKKYYFKKALKVKVANTTGAGDAFGSAFAASLIYGPKVLRRSNRGSSDGEVPNDFKRALAWGLKNSVAVIQKVGAQNGLLSIKQITK